LTLDRRKIYNVPFLVLPLKSHDIIIGKSFLKYFEISPSVVKRSLHWLLNHPKTSNVIAQKIHILRRILKRPSSRNYYQLDIEARDKLIKLDNKRQCARHNSIAYIQLKKLPNADITTQTDVDKLQQALEPSSKPEQQVSLPDKFNPQEPVDLLVQAIPKSKLKRDLT
jgi:hypothetical protein